MRPDVPPRYIGLPALRDAPDTDDASRCALRGGHARLVASIAVQHAGLERSAWRRAPRDARRPIWSAAAARHVLRRQPGQRGCVARVAARAGHERRPRPWRGRRGESGLAARYGPTSPLRAVGPRVWRGAILLPGAAAHGWRNGAPRWAPGTLP